MPRRPAHPRDSLILHPRSPSTRDGRLPSLADVSGATMGTRAMKQGSHDDPIRSRRSCRSAAAPLLAVGLAAVPATAAPPTELIFSEYVEGSSNNKALEIYNPDRGGRRPRCRRVRGAGCPSTAGRSVGTFPLTGTVAPGDAHVLANASADPAILAVADQTSGAGFFNGDDAILLLRGDAVVDSIGQLGFDPGTEWGSGLTSTARQHAAPCPGASASATQTRATCSTPPSSGSASRSNTFDGLGSHTAACETGPQAPVINEFSASTAGTDVEYVELLARARHRPERLPRARDRGRLRGRRAHGARHGRRGRLVRRRSTPKAERWPGCPRTRSRTARSRCCSSPASRAPSRRPRRERRRRARRR